MCKHEWYLKCQNCGAYRRGIIDILEPCPVCKQVTMWEKAFRVDYACGGNHKNYKKERSTEYEYEYNERSHDWDRIGLSRSP